jgi:hypothetical protein
MRIALKRIAKTLGILNLARRVRGAFRPVFEPAKPRSLVAVNKGLQWAMEWGTAEGSDYLEFGIYKGFSLWYAQAVALDANVRDMRFFGFDSFSGLPPVVGKDKGGSFFEGDFACSEETVRSFLDRNGTDWKKTFLVKGWFDQTLTPAARETYGLRTCSVCLIDCDLYESTRDVLNFIEPLLKDKTVLIFDDWSDFGNDPSKGEQKAFSEFLEKNPRIKAEPFRIQGYNGCGFIVRL